MPRSVSLPGAIAVSAIVCHCALGAQIFIGSVEDRSKAPIEGAKVSIWSDAAKKGFENTTNSSGQFVFKGIGDGDYLLKVERDGKSTVYGAFHMETDAEHKITVVMQNGDPVDPLSVEAGGPIHYWERPWRPSFDTRPVKIQFTRKVDPVYPPAAKKAHLAGSVKISMVILKSGIPDDLVVLFAPHESLAVAALKAVRQWRYEPPTLDGAPIDVPSIGNVNFRFENR